MYYLVLTIVGIASMLVLFYKIPQLIIAKEIKLDPKKRSVSVIIPVRNESKNISELLKCLKHQSYTVDEIICVDDESSDNTKEVVSGFKDVVLVSSNARCCINGKAVACQKGADIAKGELLLFLDADVRLSTNAIKILLAQYDKDRQTISVQPYHTIGKWYENISYFFNMIQLGSNGSSCAVKLDVAGLYGPVILMEKRVYNAIGGHRCAVDSIVDDMELGKQLTRLGYKFCVKTGGDCITFRMYPDGIKSLLQGWTKNISSGAGYTSPLLFILTFLWITGMSASILFFAQTIFSPDIYSFFAVLLSYCLWVVVLWSVSLKIGNFRLLTTLFYPLLLLSFFGIFAVSVTKKLLNIAVIWRGRSINLSTKH